MIFILSHMKEQHQMIVTRRLDVRPIDFLAIIHQAQVKKSRWCHVNALVFFLCNFWFWSRISMGCFTKVGRFQSTISNAVYWVKMYSTSIIRYFSNKTKANISIIITLTKQNHGSCNCICNWMNWIFGRPNIITINKSLALMYVFYDKKPNIIVRL